MKIITCFNSKCRFRLPIHKAKNVGGRLFCTPCGEAEEKLSAMTEKNTKPEFRAKMPA